MNEKIGFVFKEGQETVGLKVQKGDLSNEVVIGMPKRIPEGVNP